MTRASRRPRWRTVAAAWLTLALSGAGLSVAAANAHAEGSVTGGSNFSNVILELPQGAQVEDVYEMHVANQSTAVVTQQLQWSEVYGIDIVAPKRDFTLLPGASATVPFNIIVREDTPAGEYQISLGMFRRDVQGRPDNVVFIPGVTQELKLRVLGDAGTAKVRVVDKYKQEALSGLISVARVSGSVRTEIARRLGDVMNVRAVPGTYEASVFLDGRRVALKQFTVVNGQQTDVLVEVEAIFIRDVSLLPVKAGGKLQTIEVTASVENSLRALPQASLFVEVLRNNKPLETLEMQKFAPLETGATSASLRYVPKDGWKNGRYTFVVRLEAPEFTVKAANEPSYSIGGAVVSRLGFALGGAGLLALIAALAVAFWLRKRQHDKAKSANGRRIPDRNRPVRDGGSARM